MILSELDDLGLLVRQRRRDLGLSQTELAERVGVTRQLLSRFEQGRSDPPVATVLRLLRAMELSIDVRTRDERAAVVEVRLPRAPAGPVRVPRLSADALTALAGMAEALQRSPADATRGLTDFVRQFSAARQQATAEPHGRD